MVDARDTSGAVAYVRAAPGGVAMTTLDQETAGLFAGSYPLGRLLGRGGMADVYASVDARTGDPVAVKVFRDTDLGGADRRSTEVGMLTGLRHPNLVELIDAGTQDGCEFLVMALVEGPTLRQACSHRRVPLSRSAQIAAAVGDALAYVHAGDVVHRDVKPDNVLLGPGPRVRLADFGIARTTSATRLTHSGLVLGTAAYLAPEQVTGAEVGPPADVYALGLVLLECLSGHREYPGTALESAMARLHRSPQLPAELPAGWAALLAAMTATDSAARPSAGSAAGALHQLAAAPHTTVAALAQAMGAPLRVPIPAAPAPPAAAVAPAVAADADPGRAAAGDTRLRGGRRRWRLLALAAATLLALTPAGVAGERALRSGSSPGQPTPGTQGAPVPGVVAQPVAPPARHQPADAARLEPPAAQAGRASAPQPSAPAAGGSGDTQAIPAAGASTGSPPTATSTPVAGPAGSPGAVGGAGGAGGASGAAGGASREGPASSSTTTGGPGPAGAGSPAARAGSSSAASTGGAPGGTSPSPSGSSSAAAPSSAPPSRSPGDATSGPATSGATSTAPSPSAPTSVATPSGPGSTTSSGAGQRPGTSTSTSHGPSGNQHGG